MKNNLTTRIISMILALAFCFTHIGMVAQVAQAEAPLEAAAPELVQNFGASYYKQDGTQGSSSDWEVRLEKTAAATNERNVFEVTLQIQTKDTTMQLAGSTHGAATLVLDLSRSMLNRVSGKSSVTRLQSLKAAVAEFLDEFVSEASANDKRMISVVIFGSHGITVQDWIDINNTKNLNQVKNVIESLSLGGKNNNYVYLGNSLQCIAGTNMEAGLVLGRNLLNDANSLAGIPVSNQSLILFSDGEPTASASSIFATTTDSIGYEGDDYGTETNPADYNNIPYILSGVKAAKIAVSFEYKDSLGILKTPTFTRVIESTGDTLAVDLVGEAGKVITTNTSANAVTDPMGTGVTMLTVSSNYNEVSQKWDLSQLTPVVENGITTYTISYLVEIDPEAVAADPQHPGYTVLTPANGTTTLSYTVGEAAAPVNAAFQVPNIRGIRSFQVNYIYEGDVPANAPALPVDGNAYLANANVTAAAVPSMEGYTFTGWKLDGQIVTQFQMPASDVTLVGTWAKRNTYNYAVIYNANFGANETVADLENVSGTYTNPYEILVDENMFSRDNYTFKGWATAPNGAVVYQKDAVINFTASGEITLYAIWDENPKFNYEVIYNANFGANETAADAQNLLNTYATSHEILVDGNMFSRANYTFKGWATAPNGAVVYQKDAAIQFNASGKVELYAIWEENEKFNYEVIYNANFGTNETFADAQNLLNTYNTAHEILVDENMFSRDNYTFKGWATAPNGQVVYQAGEVISFTASGRVILFAIWEENAKFNYEVIYNANFGANETAADAQNLLNTYATAHSITVDAIMFQNANHSFQGWAETPNGAVVYQAGAVINFNASGKVTLYAVWDEHPKFSYEVVYNANFGANETAADAQNLLNTYATAHEILVDENMFSRANYTFLGWATAPDGEVVYRANDVIGFTASGKVVLFAIWEENAKYSFEVVYDANFGAEPMLHNDTENLFGVYASTHSIHVDSIMFSRPNFTFKGWATAPDGKVVYQANDVIGFTASGKVILYAVWENIASFDYEIIYNANFGRVPEIKGDSENIYGTQATSYSIGIDFDVFTRRGYRFMGWATSPDGPVVYTEQGAVRMSRSADAANVIHFENGGSITLYAVWASVATYSYELVYSANFGQNPAIRYDEQNAYRIPSSTYYITIDALMFARPGYNFLGWAKSPDGEVVYSEGNIIGFANGGRMVLYAVWEKIPTVPTEPATEPTIPSEPTVPTTEPTIPTEPTEPATEPTIPTEPTEPATEPTIPTEPTEPATEPTIPTEPTAPTTEPTPPTTEEDLTDLQDDDVPLDNTPDTGDPMIMLTGLAALSGTGLSVMLNLKKKDEEASEEA